MPIFRQKFISFLIVERATSCGVVTMIAPSGFALSNSLITVKCSSDVPGGVSVEENIFIFWFILKVVSHCITTDNDCK